MNVDGNKIKQLVRYYGELKGYEEKSHLTQFCDDFKLNYNQWSAYTRSDQEIGIKIIQKLMDIFPNLNLNWLIKNVGTRFLDELDMKSTEPEGKIAKEITNDMLLKKLEQIHFDVRQIK